MSRDFKVVSFGAGGVGKSALAIKYVQGEFIIRHDPTVEGIMTEWIILFISIHFRLLSQGNHGQWKSRDDWNSWHCRYWPVFEYARFVHSQWTCKKWSFCHLIRWRIKLRDSCYSTQLTIGNPLRMWSKSASKSIVSKRQTKSQSF